MKRPMYLPIIIVIIVGLTLVLSSCGQQGEAEITEPENGDQATVATTALATAPRPTPLPLVTRLAADEQDEAPAAATLPVTVTAEKPTSEAVPTVQETPADSRESEWPEGALIGVNMNSRVGVLLDELPAGVRDQAAVALLERPDSFWWELARRQVRLAGRRLNFRNFVYDGKGQLPLPPEELWQIELDPAGPARETIQGHDLLTIGYTFSSTLLTDAASPAAAEAALARPGGRWDEPFIFPADPDLLLQRTGNACLDEAGFPPNSFDSENAWIFYDFSCQGDSGGVNGCHRTRLNSLSCLEALDSRVGTIDTAVQFERLAWDADLADSVRLGQLTHSEGPDLKVVGQDLENNRVIYRYFSPDSCALLEQCVGGSGWRRLLQFDATVHNLGGEAMHVGAVANEDPDHNMFQYNACHNHFHFSDYGDFFFTEQEQNLSSKQAFCVESTSRLSNNEWSPLTHDYSCSFQGVQAGWVDEYQAGLDCQWIDITDFDIPTEGADFTLGFISNPDKFLCEGTPVLDEAGNRLWEPSGLTTAEGETIERPQCDLVPDWDANNRDSREVFLLPSGGFVSEPCRDGVIGPLRNCGFSAWPATLQLANSDELPAGQSIAGPGSGSDLGEANTCTAGQSLQLSCSVDGGAAPQVLRVCEYSEVLGTGTACVYEESLANVTVGREEAEITFTCPFARSEEEPGGFFAFYTAPLYDQGEAAAVSCHAN